MTRLLIMLCFCFSVQALAFNGEISTTPESHKLPTIVNNDLTIYQQNSIKSDAFKENKVSNRFGKITSGELRDNKLSLSQEPLDLIDEDNIIGGSTTYQIGRFSAETGIINQVPKTYLQILPETKQYFIQGSYAVVQKEKLNIAVLAKIETYQNSINDPAVSNLNKNEQEKLTNTTVGFIGFYALTPQWAIVGAITSSQNSPEELGAVVENEANHSALIGTTYSF